MCDICGSSCSVGVSHEEGIVKGKFHLITGDEGPEEEERYSSILSLTSAIDVVGGQLDAPAALSPGETRYPLCRRLGGPQSF